MLFWLYGIHDIQDMVTAQKMKISVKDFFCKCDQMCRFRRIWSHLLKKLLMENFIFSAVGIPDSYSDFDFHLFLSSNAFTYTFLV